MRKLQERRLREPLWLRAAATGACVRPAAPDHNSCPAVLGLRADARAAAAAAAHTRSAEATAKDLDVVRHHRQHAVRDAAEPRGAGADVWAAVEPDGCGSGEYEQVDVYYYKHMEGHDNEHEFVVEAELFVSAAARKRPRVRRAGARARATANGPRHERRGPDARGLRQLRGPCSRDAALWVYLYAVWVAFSLLDDSDGHGGPDRDGGGGGWSGFGESVCGCFGLGVCNWVG